MNSSLDLVGWHGTTILCVRRNGDVAMAGDRPVTLGQTVIKSNARKVRRIGDGAVVAGFAGSTADAFTLLDALVGWASNINHRVENIGARRLHTVLKKIFDKISFSATDRAGEVIAINAAYVDERVALLAARGDLSRFTL